MEGNSAQLIVDCKIVALILFPSYHEECYSLCNCHSSSLLLIPSWFIRMHTSPFLRALADRTSQFLMLEPLCLYTREKVLDETKEPTLKHVKAKNDALANEHPLLLVKNRFLNTRGFEHATEFRVFNSACWAREQACNYDDETPFCDNVFHTVRYMFWSGTADRQGKHCRWEIHLAIHIAMEEFLMFTSIITYQSTYEVIVGIWYRWFPRCWMHWGGSCWQGKRQEVKQLPNIVTLHPAHTLT